MVERNMLLEGEDPSTLFAEDARHWVNIYAQLLDFKQRILERIAAAMHDLPPQAAAAVERDVELIAAEARRVELRLAFWQQRHWELIGLDLNEDAHTLMYAGRKVYLTRREFQLLSFLADHPNRYFTAAAIVGSAWHDSRLSSEQLRLYVSRLREKLSDLGPPCRIDNKVGQGYGLIFTTP
jgi:DNA-binding response OmpR family regulator